MLALNITRIRPLENCTHLFTGHGYPAGPLFDIFIPGRPWANAADTATTIVDDAPTALLIMGRRAPKLHPDMQIRYLPVAPARVPTVFFRGTGDLGGGDAPIPEQQLQESTHPSVELPPTVLVGTRPLHSAAARPVFALQGRCLRISTLEKQLRGATRRLPG